MSSICPEIEKRLHQQAASMNDMIEFQPELFQIVNACLEINSGALGAWYSLNLDNNFRGTSTQLMLAHTILQYLEDAFFLTANRRLDEASALIRMASEATRDLLRISENRNTEAIFLAGKTRTQENRRLFMFTDKSALEKALWGLYKLCSEYGVHGHTLRIMNQNAYDYHDGGKAVETRILDITIYEKILFWLRAYRIIVPLVFRTINSQIKTATEFPPYEGTDRRGQTLHFALVRLL